MQTEDVLSALAPTEALLRIAIAMVSEPAMWQALLRKPKASECTRDRRKRVRKAVRSGVTRFNAIGRDYSIRHANVISALRTFHGMNVVRIGTDFGTCWTEVAWKRFIAIRWHLDLGYGFDDQGQFIPLDADRVVADWPWRRLLLRAHLRKCHTGAKDSALRESVRQEFFMAFPAGQSPDGPPQTVACFPSSEPSNGDEGGKLTTKRGRNDFWHRQYAADKNEKKRFSRIRDHWNGLPESARKEFDLPETIGTGKQGYDVVRKAIESAQGKPLVSRKS